MNHEVANNEFQICETSCGSLNIFDYKNVMPEVSYDEPICDRKIELYNSSSLDHPAPNSLVVYQLKINKENARLSIFRPYSGAAITFFFEKNDMSNFRVSSTEVGTF